MGTFIECKGDERLLLLTQDEIELIDKALNFVFDHQLRFVGENRNTLDVTVRKAIIKNAKEYGELASSIAESEKDV